MNRTRARGTLALSGLLLILATSLPVSQVLAQGSTDSFSIAYGDSVADGVPAAGAGNIEAAGATDSYAFEASAGDVAIFDVLAGSTTTFLWRLTDPTGASVFDAFFVDRAATLPQAGTYTLEVRGFTATSAGTYSFRLLLTPPAEEFAIAFDDVVSNGVPESGAGNIEVPGAIDRYRFEGLAGQLAIFDRLTGSTNEVAWRLNAPDGSLLFDAFFVDQQAALPADGTYTLTVRGLHVASSGTYSFQLLSAGDLHEFDIAFGDVVSDGVPGPGAGNIEVPGAIDRYRFEGLAGQLATFDVLAGNTNEVAWRLSAPDGSHLFDAFFVDQQAALPADGTYTLTVRGLNVASFGTYSFQLLEAPANQPPVANDDEAETDYGQAVSIDVLANDLDPDGDDLEIVSLDQPANGTAEIDGGLIAYTPAAGFWGSDSFSYTIADSLGATAQATVTVVVREPVNSPPTIEPIADQLSTAGDTVSLQVVAVDPDGDALAYVAHELPAGLVIDPASGEISGTIGPDADTGSPYAVLLTVSDPHGASASTAFSWTVTPAGVTEMTVAIDVLPRCFVNDGLGLIPVLIYGSNNFAVRQIQLASIRLEGMPVRKLLGHYLAVRYDVDEDGYDDLLVLVDNIAGAVPAGTTSARLTGSLRDGTYFGGEDDICLTSWRF